MYDLVIIGGGPAALTAAVFALGKKLNLQVISEDLGGWNGSHQRIVAECEEERIAGEGLVQYMAQDVERAHVVLHDKVLRVMRNNRSFTIETQRHGLLETLAVLVATGARPVQLDVPGAQEFLGQGLGYSTTTHAHLLARKTVAVIGSTERALRGVIELAQNDAIVYVLVDDVNEIDSPLISAIQSFPNVTVLTGYQIQEITGGFSVEELVIEHNGETRRIAIDAIFADCGLIGNSDVVANLVQTDLNGFIKVDERRATSAPGVFAAGDVTTAVGEQKLIAIGEGARAAWTAYGYILAQRVDVGIRQAVLGEA